MTQPPNDSLDASGVAEEPPRAFASGIRFRNARRPWDRPNGCKIRFKVIRAAGGTRLKIGAAGGAILDECQFSGPLVRADTDTRPDRVPEGGIQGQKALHWPILLPLAVLPLPITDPLPWHRRLPVIVLFKTWVGPELF
jgi:hypothetical protein